MDKRKEHIFNRNKEGESTDLDKKILQFSEGPEEVFAHKTDNEIWRSFQSGHEGAFEWIYNHYFDKLYAYGTQLTQNEHAEDIIQDFFIDLRLKRGKGLGDVANIKAYLFKSFRRRVFRSLKNNKFLHQEISPEVLNFYVTFSHETQLVNSQLKEEQKQAIEKAINNLTTRQKEVIYHYFFEDMDYKSIADVMGLSSAKTARDLMYKSLSVLRSDRDNFQV